MTSITVTSKTRSAINLAVSLASTEMTSGKAIGGKLYCTALFYDISPSSIGAIKSSLLDGMSSRGSSVSVPTGSSYPLTLPLSIAGLSAVQGYSVYCYAETSMGNGVALERVKSVRAFVTTACCKSVTFTNAPAYVYLDVQKYNSSSSALFVFSFSLSSSPASTMVVTPTIYQNGSISKSIFAYPRTMEIRANAAPSGQFYLTGSPNVAADCTVFLSLTGSDANLYESTSVAVKVLRSFSLPPAPSMSTVRLSDSGDAILVTLDSNTDRANIATPSWPCSELFRTVGVTFATCTWLSASVVSVSFPRITTASSAVTYAKAGDTFTLLGGLLRPLCTSSADSCAAYPTARTSSKNILQPANPVMPSATVSAATAIDLCANLILDATGSTGQGHNAFASVAWTVSAIPSVNTTAVEKYLNAYSAEFQVSRPIVIMRRMLKDATYTFTLQLVNSFNLISSKSVKVVVMSDALVPAFSIVGAAYQTMYATSTIYINCAAHPSVCHGAVATWTYKWEVMLEGVKTSLQSMSRDPTTFQPRPHSFQVDKTYTVTVTAFTGNRSSSASVQVYVAHGYVTAAVVGGYMRSVPVDKDLLLDASISADADTPPGVPSSLSYKVIQTSVLLC